MNYIFFFNILFILRVPPIFIGEYFIRFHTGKTEKRERDFQLLIQDEVHETIIGSLHQKVNQNISGN